MEQPSKKKMTKAIGMNGHWQYRASLVEGAFGFAALWVKYRAGTIKISDRMVTKDCYLGDRWQSVSCWDGDVDDRVPKEHAIMKRLEAAGESIVHCSGCMLDEHRKMYCLSLEYAEHRDLQGLLDEHMAIRSNPPSDENGTKIDFYLPERALWAIFASLCAALQHMKQAHIMHRDIKPANILLTSSRRHEFPGIPVAKLADFGLACFENDFGAQRPGAGTRGYMAPEQLPAETSENRPPPSTNSDLWAVGRVMLSLMNVEDFWHRFFGYEEFTLETPEDALIFYGTTREFYSRELLGSVRMCLWKHPENRMKLDDLRRYVGVEVAKWKGKEAAENEVILFKEDK